jgi:alanyl-tRNA synthetase
MNNLLYIENPEILEFEANILNVQEKQTGLYTVILDRSYFYPTGGGQEHDTGFLNEAKVIDVIKDENHSPALIHIVDRLLIPGPVTARIDVERRFRHMQHHTAQHLLTQCILQRLNLETVAANINGYSPTSLDLPVKAILQDQIQDVERLANQVIFENRPVQSYFSSQADLEKLPLRKQPPLVETIRIVEISGFDWTPCAGTHCASTGQIGLLKITRTEHLRDHLRVYFVAGLQAYDLLTSTYEIVTSLCSQFSLHPKDLATMVTTQAAQLKQTQKELRELRMANLVNEAQCLANTAHLTSNGLSLVKFFDGRPASEVRLLAEELRKIFHGLACLFTFDESKLTAIVISGDQSLQSARTILNHWLSPIQGKGGGDDKMAQGGAKMTQESYQEFIRQLKDGFQPGRD